MKNFSAADHDNTLNPYNLSAEEAEAVYETVDDERFINPDGEYFHLQLKNELVEIPKQRKIGVTDEDDQIKTIAVADYVSNRLAEAEEMN